MKCSMIRDQKRRKSVADFELKRLELQYIVQNLSLPLEIRYKFQKQLETLPRDSSKTRIKNRCIVSGRGRAVYRFCRLSRISLRELASRGLLPGVVKSSW